MIAVMLSTEEARVALDRAVDDLYRARTAPRHSAEGSEAAVEAARAAVAAAKTALENSLPPLPSRRLR